MGPDTLYWGLVPSWHSVRLGYTSLNCFWHFVFLFSTLSASHALSLWDTGCWLATDPQMYMPLTFPVFCRKLQNCPPWSPSWMNWVSLSTQWWRSRSKLKWRTSSLISREKSSWMKRYMCCEPVRHRLVEIVLRCREFGTLGWVCPGVGGWAGYPFNCPELAVAFPALWA